MPKEILDSKERFAVDSPEMAQMRSHPVHSRQILTDMGMSKSIVNVASYHHVKKDTSLPNSYPDVPFDDVMPVTRLAAEQLERQVIDHSLMLVHQLLAGCGVACGAALGEVALPACDLRPADDSSCLHRASRVASIRVCAYFAHLTRFDTAEQEK